MAKPNRDIRKKKRGPPPQGGRKPPQLVRMDEHLISAIDGWRKKQKDGPSRPEAIRRLVKQGLAVRHKLKQPRAEVIARARELAGKAIDKMSDGNATADDQSYRKRRLLKGPEEFRNSRIDRAKVKP